MNGRKNTQDEQLRWERAKMITTIIDAVVRIAEILLRY